MIARDFVLTSSSRDPIKSNGLFAISNGHRDTSETDQRIATAKDGDRLVPVTTTQCDVVVGAVEGVVLDYNVALQKKRINIIFIGLKLVIRIRRP